MKLIRILVVLCFSVLWLPAQNPFPDPGEVFRDDVIPRIDILIPEDSIVDMLKQENLESYHHYLADFIFDNGAIRDTFEDVGFRLRGNTSRHSQKKSFKVSFNTFVPGRKFYGLEKLNLNGEHNDPSVIRSKICWDLLREMEVPAPRSNHIDLYINGVYIGLYINVEHVDEEFAGLRFGNKNGNLYKCLYPADLVFRGSNPDAYKYMAGDHRAYELMTNTEADDYSDLANFIDVLNHTPADEIPCALDELLNIDNMIRAIAFDILSGNWDGPLYNKNNFYLYHNTRTGKFEYIPYDLDNTLGIDWLNQDWGTRNIYTWGKSDEPRPLFYAFLSAPEHRDRLSYYLDQFMQNYFSENALFGRIDSIRARITPSALNDPYRPLDYGFTIQDFLNSYNQALDNFHVQYGLKPYITTRRNRAFGQLENFDIAPVIREVNHRADYENNKLEFFAGVADDTGVDWVKCCISPGGDAGIQCFDLIDNGQYPDGTAGDGVYSGSFTPATFSGHFSYYIEATDQGGQYYRDPVCKEYLISLGDPDNGLKINELMADNKDFMADDEGGYDDWLELFNAGNESVFLGDKYLTDDAGDPFQWKLPNSWLAPGEFLLIWADDEGQQGLLHANFKLSKNGEFLGIYDKVGLEPQLLDGLDFGAQEEDISYGRWPDGIGNYGFMHPTPGGPNAPVGIEETGQVAVQLFPNPATDGVTLRFDPSAGTISDISLINSMGLRVQTLDRTQTSDGAIRIDTKSLSRGLYVLRIHRGGVFINYKLLLQ